MPRSHQRIRPRGQPEADLVKVFLLESAAPLGSAVRRAGSAYLHAAIPHRREAPLDRRGEYAGL